MMKARKSISILTAVLAAATFSSALVIPAANAAESDGPVTSSRSFKGVETRSSLMLKEATSVEVNANANYGGIESLNVPKTESKAEKEAKAQAAAEAKAAKEQAEAAKKAAAAASTSPFASTQSASRSSERTSTSSSDASTTPTQLPSGFVNRALSVIGAGYQSSGYNWTGTVSTSSFTCSGLVDFALGYPSNSNWPEKYYGMVSNKTTDLSQLKSGDLVFFKYAGRSPGHVGIYIGNGTMVDSAPGGGVQVRAVNPGSANFMGGGSL
ncbi:C40 family peptidase [Bifidobacterium sp. 82T24]|uniref:NlpC/P60 family protein n=1 Tax=Bifidobacterium pluvialisilvae TaxID=2834436 RepID=UPI001C56A91C|nr:NlpC/P60 family protein [Bifidobacterium pluvialisilvae]MBW3087669.1 C40 family peptidase [Bifidobacterium pluvialisilvae]